MAPATRTGPRNAVRRLGALALVGVSGLLLAGCASSGTSAVATDYSAASGPQIQTSVASLSSRYREDPDNKALGIDYATALRAAGQTPQAATVMESLVGRYPDDPEVALAYAKALSAQGRFEQALAMTENATDPVTPDWEALSVRGAILDQIGQHEAARQAYSQALLLAPDEAGLFANLGLSYAMTNELTKAESQLRQAVELPGATSQVRQNLALVLGLQGRFGEAEAMFAQELPPEEVQENMAYIRTMLTQQNRWDSARQG